MRRMGNKILYVRRPYADPRMVAYVCPHCHRVRYFPIGTESHEEQPDGSRRRRVCDKCAR